MVSNNTTFSNGQTGIFSAPSGPPLNVVGEALDSRTLHLTWLPPEIEERNGQIVQYVVNLTSVEKGDTKQFHTEDYRSSMTISKLHPYYVYNYTVTAVTVVGDGPYSNIRMPQDSKKSLTFVIHLVV